MSPKGYSSPLHVLCFVLILVKWSVALRLTNMTAPALQDPRRDMHLHCRFDMGGEELYAVKWYKDDHEFYRYTPRDDNIVRYEVPGAKVDASRSRCDRAACDVVLTAPRRPHSSGAYRCEVSSEAPAFRLASQTHNVTVAALPEELPVIRGLKDSYTIGELIQAQCSSGWGDPKPILTWYIDNKKVPSKELPSPAKEPSNDLRINLTRTTSQIQHQLGKNLASNKHSTPLEIRCESSIEGIGPSLAPPQSTTKTVMVLDPAQVVNNLKLHWPDSGASKVCSRMAWVVLAVSVMMLMC